MVEEIPEWWDKFWDQTIAEPSHTSTIRLIKSSSTLDSIYPDESASLIHSSSKNTPSPPLIPHPTTKEVCDESSEDQDEVLSSSLQSTEYMFKFVDEGGKKNYTFTGSISDLDALKLFVAKKLSTIYG